MVEFYQKLLDADYSYGGYLEDRSVLWKGNYLAQGRTTRTWGSTLMLRWEPRWLLMSMRR